MKILKKILKNKLGENVYSLEEISKMSGFEIENLYDLYSNKKDSKEIAQNFETKINENDPLNSKQIPVENDFFRQQRPDRQCPTACMSARYGAERPKLYA